MQVCGQGYHQKSTVTTVPLMTCPQVNHLPIPNWHDCSIATSSPYMQECLSTEVHG